MASATELDDSWPLYRWNPALEARGMDPFSLDSAKLKSDVHEFVKRDQAMSLMARRLPHFENDISAEHTLKHKQHVAHQVCSCFF